MTQDWTPGWYKQWQKQWQGFLEKTPFYYLLIKGPSLNRLTITPSDPWPGNIKRGSILLEGRFSLGHTTISFDQLWDHPSLTHQQYEFLHGFESLRDLRAVGDNAARRLARRLITHWILSNRNWRDSSWSAATLSTRISNWLSTYEFFGASADEKFNKLFFRSLTQQFHHLKRRYFLETDPFACHQALKGLIIASVTLSKYRSGLLRYLETEIACLKQQFDNEGCHISRLPQRQFLILKDLIEIRTLLRQIGIACPSEIQNIIESITPSLRLLRHGDGELCYFGADLPQPTISEIDVALSLSDVKGKSAICGGIMNFIRLQSKQSLILINGGIPLSNIIDGTKTPLDFEWSLGKNRIIVHTDLIASQPHPDLPGKAKWVHHQNDGHQLIQAIYEDAYMLHRRVLYISPDLHDIRGEEVIRYAPHELLKLRIFLHPSINIATLRGGKGALIQLKDGQTWRLHLSQGVDVSCHDLPSNKEYFANLPTLVLNIPPSGQSQREFKWAIRQA